MHASRVIDSSPESCGPVSATVKPDTVSRVNSVELVRGLAALAVCLFHFTKSIWPDDSIVRHIGSYGWAGVESFFVISGFIIPFAMHRTGYRLSLFFRFMTKRYLRIAPPYLAAVIVALVLWYGGSLFSAFRGEKFHIEPGRLVAHLFFANDLVGLEWLNPVFWTLAIEFQYYIAMGILFPLLFSRSHACNILTLTGLISLVSLPHEQFLISNWVLIFLAGVTLAQWQLGCLTRIESALFGTAILALIQWHHGTIIFSATVISVAMIAWIKNPPRWGIWLGQISYALYLMHVPIGGRVVNLGMRYANGECGRWCVLTFAIAASFVAAWILWIVVERRALAWSSSIKYRPSSINVCSVVIPAVSR